MLIKQFPVLFKRDIGFRCLATLGIFESCCSWMYRKISFNKSANGKPKASQILTSHLRQRGKPAWTSYFVQYKDVDNDHLALSHFNWQVDGTNYHILRTGCYPLIKYHCTRRPYQILDTENAVFTVLKAMNVGIPTLAYGLISLMLIQFYEQVPTSDGFVKIFFLNREENSLY